MAYLGREAAKAPLVTADIPDDSITAAKIVDATIAAGDLAANSVDSSELVDGSIDTSHIADNQVTLAKMAGGTDGNIISYDASGDPVAIATGDDGQVLTSTGAGSPPAFEALPAGGATTGMISNVWRFTDTSSSILNINTTTRTVGTNASEFSATSGRHYVITGMQHISPYRVSGTVADRYQYCAVYVGTDDKALGDTSSLGTRLFESLQGRYLIANSSVNAAGYYIFSYNAWFTAASTANHYAYTVYKSGTTDMQCRAYNSVDTAHHTIIYEVIP